MYEKWMPGINIYAEWSMHGGNGQCSWTSEYEKQEKGCLHPCPANTSNMYTECTKKNYKRLHLHLHQVYFPLVFFHM